MSDDGSFEDETAKSKKAKAKKAKAKAKQPDGKAKAKAKGKAKDKAKRKEKTAKRKHSSSASESDNARERKRAAPAGDRAPEAGGGPGGDGMLQQADDFQRRRWLMEAFTPEQHRRYDAYRRSGLNKAKLRKLMTQTTGGAALSEQIVVAMAGITKLFAGQVIEEARRVQAEWNEATGPDPLPLQPRHLREALRRLRQTGDAPRSRYFERPSMCL